MNLPFAYSEPEFGDGPGLYIAIILLSALGLFLFKIIRDGAKIVRTEYVKTGNSSYSAEEAAPVDLHLLNFSYYRKLTTQGRARFIHRVLNFIETHHIEGENDFNSGFREKVHVSAAATQLTFGLRDFIFTHFETVLLYPGIFRLRADGPLMKGATTSNGVIRISIKDFDAGYANPKDKLNVGLHEFGHALFMEFLRLANAEESNEMLKTNLFAYIEESDRLLKEGKHNDNFLRDYAFTNRHEFFAVCVEHFFEAPQEFKETLPELYDALKTLLKQDTAGQLPDYAIRHAEKAFS
ncbi:MAG: zinc-dependent peptidase [Bacteroidota bacterium]|nr:zinc-dependent peptidase [Bacteroidota bacterium]